MFSLPLRENTGKNRIEVYLRAEISVYIKILRLQLDVPVTPWQGNFDNILTPEPG